jgi:hypothetical protein
MKLVDPSTVTELIWNVSRKCNGGTCVRVAHDGRTVFLGDAKNPSGPVLSCSPPQWQAFISRIKRGELDFS